MGFASCLTLLLIAAKLFGYAHYGWLVALSPVLIGYTLVAFVVIASALLKVKTEIRYR